MNLRELSMMLLASCLATSLESLWAAEPLPKSMSGRWSTMTPRGEVGNIWSIVINKQDEKGTIEGRVSHYGFNCGAKDEPMIGTFDGSVLRLQSRLRSNVNTSNAGGQCEPGKMNWTLRRKEGRDAFDGEGVFEADQTITVRVYLSP